MFEKVIDDILTEVWPFYLERPCWYHNNDHIVDVYKYAEQYNQLSEDMQYAILFHDIVYKIPAPWESPSLFTNEFQSASYYFNLLRYRKLTPSDHVVAMIKATAHHFDDTDFEDEETNWLLDFDILGFTKDYHVFKETQAKIDYEWISHGHDVDDVKRKRIGFLKDIFENNKLRYRIIPDAEERTNIAYENIERLLNDAF